MNPAKLQRNLDIVKMRDEECFSFSTIGLKYNMRKQTVHTIYHRTKKLLDHKL
jgi:hypothetical protein